MAHWTWVSLPRDGDQMNLRGLHTALICRNPLREMAAVIMSLPQTVYVSSLASWKTEEERTWDAGKLLHGTVSKHQIVGQTSQVKAAFDAIRSGQLLLYRGDFHRESVLYFHGEFAPGTGNI